MAMESYYEKRQRILKEQKARKDKRDKENAMVGGLDDGQVKKRAPKSKSSKLGSATPSKGSKNPTSAFQDMKKKDIKKSTFFQDVVAGPKTKNKKLGKVGVGLSEALRKKNIKKVDVGLSEALRKSKKKSSVKTPSDVSQGSSTTKKKKPSIVTKEQLAKSGLSLRDYMNFMQGKTRRDDKKTSTKKKTSINKNTSTKTMVDSFKKSNVSANKNKKAGIDSAKGDNKKAKSFKKNTNPKLDSKGNYKGTNIKPTKLQLDRMNKRRAKKGST